MRERPWLSHAFPPASLPATRCHVLPRPLARGYILGFEAELVGQLRAPGVWGRRPSRATPSFASTVGSQESRLHPGFLGRPLTPDGLIGGRVRRAFSNVETLKNLITWRDRPAGTPQSRLGETLGPSSPSHPLETQVFQRRLPEGPGASHRHARERSSRGPHPSKEPLSGEAPGTG